MKWKVGLIIGLLLLDIIISLFVFLFESELFWLIQGHYFLLFLVFVAVCIVVFVIKDEEDLKPKGEALMNKKKYPDYSWVWLVVAVVAPSILGLATFFSSGNIISLYIGFLGAIITLLAVILLFYLLHNPRRSSYE